SLLWSRVNASWPRRPPRVEHGHPSLSRQARDSSGCRRHQRNALPHQKIFLQKRLSHKGYPLLGGRNHFRTGFCQRGQKQFSESKSPPTGGRICRTHIQARLRCAEPSQSRPAVSATTSAPSSAVG